MKVKDIYQTMAYGPAPESAEEAIQFLESNHRKFKLFINGKWVDSSSGEYFESINPCTKEVLANISEASDSDVNKAVAAAKKALPEWIKIGPHQRARYLYALARQIQKHSRLFA